MIDLEKIRKEKPIKELINFSIINIDKPSGPTSFLVDLIVRKKLKLGKTSHFGTLDPMVTGVLPVALERACRLSTWFMKKDKTYIGIMQLHKDIEEEKLKKEIENFIGKIMQLPPIKSRVKREEREREVYSFDILEKDGRDVLFKVKCEAGTYVRKLIHDLGLKIGGAHMAELRRTEAGIFSEDASVSLYEVENAIEEYKKGNEEKLRKMLIPGEIVSRIMSVVYVKESCVKKLFTGKPVFIEDLEEKLDLKDGEKISVFSKERFIGVYRTEKTGNIFAKAEFVLN